jgi:hypothetical protein
MVSDIEVGGSEAGFPPDKQPNFRKKLVEFGKFFESGLISAWKHRDDSILGSVVFVKKLDCVDRFVGKWLPDVRN